MLKANIKIERQLTINAGNYESIRPSVSIEVLNVGVDKIDIAYQEIGQILDNVYQLEEANHYIELKEIRNNGIREHINTIMEQDMDILGENIKINLTNLKKLLTKDLGVESCL